MECAAGTAWEGPGIRAGDHDPDHVWVEVAVELAGDKGVNQAQEDALDDADAEMKRLHPTADLAG